MKTLFQVITLQIFLASMVASANPAASGVKNNRVSIELNRTLDYLANVYDTQYAPREWKATTFKWDANTVAESLKVDLSKSTSMIDARRALATFFKSTKDYHVGYAFYSSELATLPFTVRSAEGKYILVYIDRTKLGSFPFNVGDELVTLGGEPVADVFAKVKKEINSDSVTETDRAITELNLTRRRGSSAMTIPQGSVQVGIRPQGSDGVKIYQLAWDYTPELISSPSLSETKARIMSNQNIFPNPFEEKKISHKEFLAKHQMVYADAANLETLENPYGLGLKKSFLPRLGNVIWENESSKNFDAYIYLDEQRRLIGVVRIPSYTPADSAVAAQEFSQLMTRFESQTDALVIDQLNNPGGSVFYLYALASSLAKQPLFAPRHRESLNQAKIKEVQELIESLKKVTNDAEAIKALGGENIEGYPANYELAVAVLDYARFILKQWEQGKTLSDPYYLFGVDHINPNPAGTYTKPVMILVNELDFSGGDFFPTILQDNKRAKVVGIRTSGAGGYVESQSIPNMLGLLRFSYTGSIAERIDKNPIENLGVTPDVELPFTLKDLQGNFSDYTTKVREILKDMLKN